MLLLWPWPQPNWPLDEEIFFETILLDKDVPKKISAHSVLPVLRYLGSKFIMDIQSQIF